jgi:hypothetical protein
MPKTFCQTLKLMKITFRGGYSVMKQHFTYQGGQIVITAEYRGQETLTPFSKSKVYSVAYTNCNCNCINLVGATFRSTSFRQIPWITKRHATITNGPHLTNFYKLHNNIVTYNAIPLQHTYISLQKFARGLLLLSK